MDATIQITLGEAREYDPEAQIGDEIGVKLDTTGFGRILAQTAKQVIIQRVRDAERDIVFDEYKDRKGEVLNGIVRRFEKGSIIVDLGRAEADPAAQGAGAARELPARRPHPRLRPRRQPRLEGRSDRSLACVHRDADEALRPGGAGDVRGHRDHRVRGARARRPLQDRSGLARWRRRSGGSLRGHEGKPRSGRRPGAARRAHRHRAVEPGHGALRVQRALPCAGFEGDHRRGRELDGCDRPRRPALSRDRTQGTERSARRPAHRLADRHQERIEDARGCALVRGGRLGRRGLRRARGGSAAAAAASPPWRIWRNASRSCWPRCPASTSPAPRRSSGGPPSSRSRRWRRRREPRPRPLRRLRRRRLQRRLPQRKQPRWRRRPKASRRTRLWTGPRRRPKASAAEPAEAGGADQSAPEADRS